MRFKRNLQLVWIIIVTFCSCKNDNKLVLVKSNLKGWNEIDTVKWNDSTQMGILRLIKYKGLGKFDIDYAVVKGKKINYRLQFNKKLGVRISDSYIGLTKDYGEKKWGWYNVSNGEVTNVLPGIEAIIDSLYNIYPKKDYFIRHTNGYLSVLQNGTVVNSYNYGDFILDKKIDVYDNLDYKLYKVENGDLLSVTTEVDELNCQSNGVFFVPPPGLKIITLYSKNKIFEVVDSLFRNKLYPEEVKISPEKTKHNYSCY